MKYRVTIEETVSEAFEIDAESMEAALRIAEEKYRNAELILSPGNIISALFQADNVDSSEFTPWVEAR